MVAQWSHQGSTPGSADPRAPGPSRGDHRAHPRTLRHAGSPDEVETRIALRKFDQTLTLGFITDPRQKTADYLHQQPGEKALHLKPATTARHRDYVEPDRADTAPFGNTHSGGYVFHRHGCPCTPLPSTVSHNRLRSRDDRMWSNRQDLRMCGVS